MIFFIFLLLLSEKFQGFHCFSKDGVSPSTSFSLKTRATRLSGTHKESYGFLQEPRSQVGQAVSSGVHHINGKHHQPDNDHCRPENSSPGHIQHVTFAKPRPSTTSRGQIGPTRQHIRPRPGSGGAQQSLTEVVNRPDFSAQIGRPTFGGVPYYGKPRPGVKQPQRPRPGFQVQPGTRRPAASFPGKPVQTPFGVSTHSGRPTRVGVGAQLERPRLPATPQSARPSYGGSARQNRHTRPHFPPQQRPSFGGPLPAQPERYTYSVQPWQPGRPTFGGQPVKPERPTFGGQSVRPARPTYGTSSEPEKLRERPSFSRPGRPGFQGQVGRPIYSGASTRLDRPRPSFPAQPGHPSFGESQHQGMPTPEFPLRPAAHSSRTTFTVQSGVPRPVLSGQAPGSRPSFSGSTLPNFSEQQRPSFGGQPTHIGRPRPEQLPPPSFGGSLQPNRNIGSGFTEQRPSFGAAATQSGGLRPGIPQGAGGLPCFQFVPNKVLFGHAQVLIKTHDLGQCQEACNAAVGYRCLSVSFYRHEGKCLLNRQNGNQKPKWLIPAEDGAEYYENNCLGQSEIGRPVDSFGINSVFGIRRRDIFSRPRPGTPTVGSRPDFPPKRSEIQPHMVDDSKLRPHKGTSAGFHQSSTTLFGDNRPHSGPHAAENVHSEAGDDFGHLPPTFSSARRQMQSVSDTFAERFLKLRDEAAEDIIHSFPSFSCEETCKNLAKTQFQIQDSFPTSTCLGSLSLMEDFENMISGTTDELVSQDCSPESCGENTYCCCHT